MSPLKTSTRDRLLDAAARLVYREGAHVGIAAICAEAHVSKRSLYQEFATKDDLIVAALERSGPDFHREVLPADDVDGSPRALILHVFERLEDLARSEAFFGCPFVDVAVEVRDDEHPATVVARRFKHEMTSFFEKQAARLAVSDPGLLARQLTMTFDGASTQVALYGPGLNGLAVQTARALLDAAEAGSSVREARSLGLAPLAREQFE
jgi:AcrR family transcriptional regulator